MWYRKSFSQVGGGVDFSKEKTEQNPQSDIDVIKDIDNEPMGLYDELAGILEKMDKSIHDYYEMNHEQQKEIWTLLVERPHRMNVDNNGQFIVSPQSASTEARRHSPYHMPPEFTTLEEQIRGSQQANNNVFPNDSNASKRAEGFQHFKNGEGYIQNQSGKQDPRLFGQLPSNQTWF